MTEEWVNSLGKLGMDNVRILHIRKNCKTNTN